MDDFDDYNFDIFDAPQTNPALGDTIFGDNPFDGPFGTELNDAPAEDTPKKFKAKKFDEALLLEPHGLHLLKTETKHLQFKGKNHEAADLKRLMTYYAVWADNLYPKYKFTQFAKTVGTKTKGKGVGALLAEWQDEYKEKMRVRLDLHTNLSGQTVGDEEGIIRQESSDEDDNRPLFFPMSAELTERLQKEKREKEKKAPRAKKSKYRSNDYINSDDEDDEDLVVTKKPRTITFSDEEEEPKPNSAKSGRDYALSILAEKRKQRQLAQKKKEETEKMKEYDEVPLAISDSELAQLDIVRENASEPAKETEPGKNDKLDLIEMEDD